MSSDSLQINYETIDALHPSRKLPLLNYLLESRYDLCLSQAKNLRDLQGRAAKYGPLDVPLALQNQIKEAEDAIEDSQGEIKQLEHSVDEVICEIERRVRKRAAVAPKGRFGIFSDWPPFKEYTEDACEIFVAGGSLDNLTQIYGLYLVRKANDDCRVQLILMDPKSPALPQVELRSDPDLPESDYYRRAICRSLRRLAAFDRDRKLEIRLNPSIPALTVLMVDASYPCGKMRVDIQPFQATVDVRPVFELTRREVDTQWYDLFYHQYSEKLWDIAEPVNLDDVPPICLELVQSDTR